MTRNTNLDILRAVAVLAVLARHFGALDCGWAGVDLFFVLSGFLVSGLLFSEWQKSGSMDVKRFYVRRAWRIYPAFYVFLLITSLLIGASLRIDSFAAAALFVQNYRTGIGPTLWTHLWSLAVEEHFYLILPPALWMLARNRFRYLPVVVAVVAVLALVLRFQAGSTLSGEEYGVWYTPTHLRLDSLAFGVLLRWLREFHPARFTMLARSRWMALPVVAAGFMLAVFPLESPAMHTYGFTVLYLGFGALLVMVFNRKRSPVLRPLAAMGKHSYSIYLWHAPFVLMVPHAGLGYFGLYLALAIGGGILLSKAVEI